MFGWFGKKSDLASIEKHARRVLDKRGQAPDRWDSIQALSHMIAPAKKDGATDRLERIVDALLQRFTFYTDPTITDQEEKDLAFRAIVDAGADALPSVRKFMTRAESLSWAIKLLERLSPPEEVTSELLRILASMDTEYQRDPQRKLQVLQALEERRDARIAPAVERFLDDANETARFHAVGAILKQESTDAYRETLARLLGKEESVRVQDRILEHFAARGWSVGAATGILVQSPPPGWKVGVDGIPMRV